MRGRHVLGFRAIHSAEIERARPIIELYLENEALNPKPYFQKSAA